MGMIMITTSGATGRIKGINAQGMLKAVPGSLLVLHKCKLSFLLLHLLFHLDYMREADPEKPSLLGTLSFPSLVPWGLAHSGCFGRPWSRKEGMRTSGRRVLSKSLSRRLLTCAGWSPAAPGAKWAQVRFRAAEPQSPAQRGQAALWHHTFGAICIWGFCGY